MTTYAIRVPRCLGVLLGAMPLVVLSACSEEEGRDPEEKKYSPEVQAVRDCIFRDGKLTRALDAYYFGIGSYPTTEQGLKALSERPSGLADPAHWQGPYLKEADQSCLKDFWGNDLKYTYPGKTHEKKYDLVSFGPDGQEGTGDDILNWNVR